MHDDDELIPIKEACRLLGGFHAATYYRGVAEGRFPKPVHPSPNISRVSRRKVLEVRARILEGGADASAA
jgi:predicted DNA-binding transcriptional regulator AlpA